jgi:predicted RNA polymerase sigma factor
MVDWRAVAEHVFKEESARILAGLIRLCGHSTGRRRRFRMPSRALVDWPGKRVPDNPGAWIMAVARRRIIDRARREATRTAYQQALTEHIEHYGAEPHDDTVDQESMSACPTIDCD